MARTMSLLAALLVIAMLSGARAQDTPAPTPAPAPLWDVHECGAIDALDRQDADFFSYHEIINGAVEYSTCEDNPQWSHCLPSLGDDIVEYELSCFPKMAEPFEWDGDGCFSYTPRKDVFSRDREDKDVFSYHGFVPSEIGLQFPDLYDCQNMVQDGNRCKTELRLVNVYVGPVNDAPIAAFGESYIAFAADRDIVRENAEYDTDRRLALEPPFALVRTLVGTDIDDTTLRYTITRQPDKGFAMIVEGNVFKYIPEPTFTGQDFFEYSVDDSPGPAEIGPRPLSDVGRVIVQVGEQAEIPPPIAATLALDEDSEIVGVLGRGYYTGARGDLIRYEITDRVNFGEFTLLCDGLEVYDPVDCNRELNENSTDLGPSPRRQAFFHYKPYPDRFGLDVFEFKIYFEGFENDPELQTDPVPVTLNVRPVNDPPTVFGGIYSAPMIPEKGNIAGLVNVYGVIVIEAADIDSTILDLRIQRRQINGTKLGVGELYAGLTATGIPKDPLDLTTVATVEMVNKKVALYYVAPALERGEPLGMFTIRATDRLSFSAPDSVDVNVACMRGYQRGEPGTPEEFFCSPCGAGTVSILEDAPGCTPCLKGTYSPGGLQECLLCDAGTFAPNISSSSCDSCPWASSSQPGSDEITDCFCTAGYYGEGGKPCLKCPEVGRQDANTDDVDRADLSWTYCGTEGLRWPLPQRGFWVNTDQEPVTMRECSPLDACLHLTGRNDDALVAEGNSCAAGYEGDACCQCGDDHYRAHGRCKKCPGDHVFPIVVIAFLVIVLMPLAFKLTNFVAHFAAVDIVVLFTQVSGIFGFYYLKWPKALTNWFNVSSAFNLNLELLHLECNYEWDFEKKWTYTMLIPLVALLAIVIVQLLTFFVMIFQRTVGRGIRERNPAFAATRLGRMICGRRFVTAGVFAGKSKEDFKRLVWHTIRGYLTFLHIGYVFLSMGTFEMFDCVKSITDGRSWLEPSPCIECYVYDSDTTWGKLYPYAVLCTLIYPVGIFVLFGAMLYWARDKLAERRTSDLLGFVIHQYKPEFFWYQMAVLSRLFALSLVITANRDSSAGGALRQAVIALLVLMFAQITKAISRPFNSPRLDAMEAWSLLSNFCTLMCGATFVSFKITNTFRNFLTVVNVVLIIITYIVFFFMVVWDFIPTLIYRLKAWWRYRKAGSAVAGSASGGGGKGKFRQNDMPDLDPAMEAFLNPVAGAALYHQDATDEEVEEVKAVFRELLLCTEVNEFMENGKDLARPTDYMHPEVARELVNRMSKRSVDDNDEMLRVVEQVDALETDEGLKARYDAAKAELLAHRQAEADEYDDVMTGVAPTPNGGANGANGGAPVTESFGVARGGSGALSPGSRAGTSAAGPGLYSSDSRMRGMRELGDDGAGSDTYSVSASDLGLVGFWRRTSTDLDHDLGTEAGASVPQGSDAVMQSVGSEEEFQEMYDMQGTATASALHKDHRHRKVHPM